VVAAVVWVECIPRPPLAYLPEAAAQDLFKMVTAAGIEGLIAQLPRLRVVMVRILQIYFSIRAAAVAGEEPLQMLTLLLSKGPTAVMAAFLAVAVAVADQEPMLRVVMAVTAEMALCMYILGRNLCLEY
jgi:hypothetical protein